ncbi:MAG: acetoin utilization protein AcuC [Salinarimonas sp.]
MNAPFQNPRDATRAPLFIGSEIYRGSSYGTHHPLRIPRVSSVMDLGRALGWIGQQNYVTSPRAKPAALTLWHTPDYIAALQRAEAEGEVDEETRKRHNLGVTANPVFPEVYRRPATSAGGTMLAADLVRDGGVVHVPAGGTHHAFPDYANGFCYFNDPVLCLLRLRQLGFRRVAYVDIDAHHCDGVAHAFEGDADALLISVHEERRWPFTGALEDDGGGLHFNLPVPRGFNDSEMRAVLHEMILPRLEAFAPQAIVMQCGSDAIEEDPLSRLALSNNAHREAVVAVREIAPRMVVMGGGGYNPWSVARCWTGIWGALNGLTAPERLPEEAEAILRALIWRGAPRVGRNPPEHWFTTLHDTPREGEVREDIRTRLRVLAQRALP